ncbi:MAG: hypothetical protein SGI77_14810 [Pirellulaceae bacterium]|nr:hypothetical protein [Pirellulaceae bacterium]
MNLNRQTFILLCAAAIVVGIDTLHGNAGVGDPQVATDHPWYPGELACSTFERLAATQATMYERVVGVKPTTDEHRAIASWLWRNTHYWHGEQGVEDLWGKGFRNDTETATRDYWTGLFAHGMGLCGTTHAQWTAEMEVLLGHNRARVVGVTGHNSFEVFLKGGVYGDGRWALLDHDVSTVIFGEGNQRLLSIAEIKQDLQRCIKSKTSDAKQQGWLVCGLHPDDGQAFDSFQSAEYLAGYAGSPPITHLRRGESMRRYVEPGLDDGRTFVYWGRNYNTNGIAGPERPRTWVNQPEKMYGSKNGSGHHDGQARYANAVFVYRPDFTNSDYREGVIDESDQHVTFEFQSPYIIAATPPNNEAWAIYQPGCRNGLVITGAFQSGVSISTNRGGTWHVPEKLRDGAIDLTDRAKGHRQYWLRFAASAKELANTQLQITTVCQANSSIIPRLSESGSRVTFQASGQAIVSAGPNLEQAEANRIAGAFDSPRVTLELAAPRRAATVGLYAAAHVASSNPPSPEIEYHIDYSTDGSKSWQPLVRDWHITREGDEPKDFWSQSFCWGSGEIDKVAQPIQVRFHNNGGKRYRRAELHLLYRLPQQDMTRVTFHWKDDTGVHTESRDFDVRRSATPNNTWKIETGKDVKTLWVEYVPTDYARSN